MNTKAIPATHKSPNPHDYHNYREVMSDLKRAQNLVREQKSIDGRQFAALVWKETGIATAPVKVYEEERGGRLRCFIAMEPHDTVTEVPKVLYHESYIICRQGSQWFSKLGADSILHFVDMLDDVETHAFAYNAAKVGHNRCTGEEGRKIAAKSFLQQWQIMHPEEDPSAAPTLQTVMRKVGAMTDFRAMKRKRDLMDDPFEPETPEEKEYAERKRSEVLGGTQHLDAFFGET